MALIDRLKQVKEQATVKNLAITTGILVGVGILVGLIASGIRVHQDWQELHQTPNDDNQKRFNASLEMTKELVGGVGTLATIAGGVVLYLNFRVATRNAEIANRNAETAAKNLQATEKKIEQEAEKARKDADLANKRLITDRFSKAVEQLGNGNSLHIRLGGIYALESVANDSDDYYWQVMEILTAYVRERSPWPPREESRSPDKTPPLPTDIQSAMTVLGRRKYSWGDEEEKYRLDLRHTDLRGVYLHGANLKGVNLRRSHLEGARIRDVLMQCVLLDDAHLQGAILFNVALEGAIIKGTNFTAVEGLTDDQLKDTYLCNTQLPDPLHHLSERDCNQDIEEWRIVWKQKYRNQP